MTTIDKLIDSIANICIDLGLRGEYSPEEIADLVCDIEFVHLYDAIRDLAEPVYAFSTDGERPMTLKYRSRKLFDRNATLLGLRAGTTVHKRKSCLYRLHPHRQSPYSQSCDMELHRT